MAAAKSKIGARGEVRVYFSKLKKITYQTNAGLAIAIIAASIAVTRRSTSNQILNKHTFHVACVAPAIERASRILTGQPIETFGALAALHALGYEIGGALHIYCSIHVHIM